MSNNLPKVKMILKGWILFFGLFSACPPAAHAQEMPFKAGEKIRFTVYYNVIGLYVNAGTATITTYQERYKDNNVFHVVGEGVTNSRYDWIFKVRDRYESYFHAENLRSLKFIRNVNEGNYKKYEEVSFDHQAKTATTTKGVYKVPENVQDVVNALFNVRKVDFNSHKTGDKINFSMFLDDEVYHMYVRYVGKETVKTKYGTFKAIRLQPLLLKGNVFEGGEKMAVWITDDQNHIPVRIESDISVGSVKVDMMEYKNLKYPLTALVKLND